MFGAIGTLAARVAFIAAVLTLGGTASAQEASAPGGALEAPSGAAPTNGSESEATVTLRGLEERVNDLKERVFRSKARLVLLRETVLSGVISGARARIVHRNDMGPSFVLERAVYTLDGEPLLSANNDDGALDGKTEIELYQGSIVPGSHSLSVQLTFRGNGYGIFTYLRDYVFRLAASYPFTAEEGKTTTVRAVAYERGGATTDLQDRPAIRFETNVKQDLDPRQPEVVGGGEAAP